MLIFKATNGGLHIYYMNDIVCPSFGEFRILSKIEMNTNFLEIFNLPKTSKEVLLDIIGNGISSVAVIARRLGMPKSTVYDAITPLLDQSLVNEYSNNHGKTFGISDNEQLKRAYEEKITELQKAQASLLSFITTHHEKDASVTPKIKFYAGTLGIKQAFRDMMWQKNITETFLYWPAKEMIDIDEDFFKWHGTQRFKYGVFIYAIETFKDRAIQRNKRHQWLHNNKDSLSSARYLPKGVDCKMSFWIYGDRCLFASGGKEKIAFTVHSKEFAQMMKMLWKSLWDKAKV